VHKFTVVKDKLLLNTFSQIAVIILITTSEVTTYGGYDLWWDRNMYIIVVIIIIKLRWHMQMDGNMLTLSP